MSPEPITTVRKADQVAEALLERIRAEHLPVGDRLPTEKEIGERYGVSRTVVREATRLLIARGIVEVGSGRGLYVSKVGSAMASESLSLFLHGQTDGDYVNVHEIREILEVEVARRAARRADAAGLAALAESHERMSRLAAAGDLEALGEADIDFHRRLAHATGNDLFVMLLDAVTPVLVSQRRTNLVRAEGREEALRAHAAILAAVTAGHEDEAASAMRAHLDYVVELWRSAERAP